MTYQYLTHLVQTSEPAGHTISAVHTFEFIYPPKHNFKTLQTVKTVVGKSSCQRYRH